MHKIDGKQTSGDQRRLPRAYLTQVKNSVAGDSLLSDLVKWLVHFTWNQEVKVPSLTRIICNLFLFPVSTIPWGMVSFRPCLNKPSTTFAGYLWTLMSVTLISDLKKERYNTNSFELRHLKSFFDRYLIQKEVHFRIPRFIKSQIFTNILSHAIQFIMYSAIVCIQSIQCLQVYTDVWNLLNTNWHIYKSLIY